MHAYEHVGGEKDVDDDSSVLTCSINTDLCSSQHFTTTLYLTVHYDTALEFTCDKKSTRKNFCRKKTNWGKNNRGHKIEQVSWHIQSRKRKTWKFYFMTNWKIYLLTNIIHFITNKTLATYCSKHTSTSYTTWHMCPHPMAVK